MRRVKMLGALVGDIVGSVYELFSPRSTFTDDSVMTLAVAMMKRLSNWYVTWFILYALICSLLLGLLVNNYDAIKAVCIPTTAFMVVVMLILISNVAGLGMAILTLYDAFVDLKMWFYNEDQWIMEHGHGIGTEGFSYERIVEHNFIVVTIALIVSVHLVLSAKRCKEIGVSAWLALIPLYNPLGLLMTSGRNLEK